MSPIDGKGGNRLPGFELAADAATVDAPLVVAAALTLLQSFLANIFRIIVLGYFQVLFSFS